MPLSDCEYDGREKPVSEYDVCGRGSYCGCWFCIEEAVMVCMLASSMLELPAPDCS